MEELVGNKATRKQLMPVNKGGKRNELELKADDWYVVNAIGQGKTYAQIASELNVMRPGLNITAEGVRLEANRCLIEWKRENLDNIDAIIGKELARLDAIEEKVLTDYEKSKNLRAIDYAALLKRGFTLEEIEDIFDGKVAGDPRYLEVILHVQKQRLKLLGIDKGNDVQQQTIVAYQFNGMSEDALAKMADALQDKMYRESRGNIDEQ